jgi:ESCRT-II complex subunit VPS36
MVTLTDVYGIFNRARGTELVSPDDFLCSVELIGTLGVGLRTKRFPSGVHMLQLAEIDEQTINQELRALSTSTPALEDEGLRAPDVAQHYRISFVVAREMLLAAETNGVLCRDDDVRGLAFFPNKFLD